VLEQHQILLVLSDKTLYSYPIEALDPEDSQAAVVKRSRKICHCNFFKAGICVGQQLVACVKTTSLSTTIKVFEPMENQIKKSKKSGLAKMLAGGQDALKPYKVKIPDFFDPIPQIFDKNQFSLDTASNSSEEDSTETDETCYSNLSFYKEFYIPTESTSIHFLRSKLCVGCARGFEVVSLETLETQSLLDQADTSLDFVARKENIKPIHIERFASEFLLCYTDFSFFVNRNGWRARPDWKITWEGNPQAFAIFNPYILAFEPSFIEIRHMESGMLVHILTAKNIRMLHSSTREVCRRNSNSLLQTRPKQFGMIWLIKSSYRYYTPMKTKWAKMSLQAWISGRHRKAHLRIAHTVPLRTTDRMRRAERIPSSHSRYLFWNLFATIQIFSHSSPSKLHTQIQFSCWQTFTPIGCACVWGGYGAFRCSICDSSCSPFLLSLSTSFSTGFPCFRGASLFFRKNFFAGFCVSLGRGARLGPRTCV